MSYRHLFSIYLILAVILLTGCRPLTTVPFFEKQYAPQVKSVAVEVVSASHQLTPTEADRLTHHIVDRLNHSERIPVQFVALPDSLSAYQTPNPFQGDSLARFQRIKAVLDVEGVMTVDLLRLKTTNAFGLIKAYGMNGCLNLIALPFTVLCGEGALRTRFNPDAQSRLIAEVKLHDTITGNLLYHHFRDHREHYRTFATIPAKTAQRQDQFQTLIDWLEDQFPIFVDD
ncbi:MAG: hypothetical protein D6675_02690 [Gemmatimonadetes bacterium]|nr:MAG: hypothetical protein D6675_02690 [Gemmatimonadota bacterium]